MLQEYKYYAECMRAIIWTNDARIIVKRPRMLSTQSVALYKTCKPKPRLSTHICVTWPQWVKTEKDNELPITGRFSNQIGILDIQSTPLWKSNRNFFSTQFFYHSFFVLCSSFYTWYMWGGKYQFCKFLLDFDHWLYLSDILKKVTGSKPDVALVWFMQWAKMEFEHGEKYRYWCIVIV